MGREKRQEAYTYLVNLACVKGYVTVDDILDCSDNFELPVTDVDWLSNSITTRGIIVYDEEPAKGNDVDDDEEYKDFAQIDYEEIFNRVIELNEDLEPLISAIRAIKPPQRREFAQLKYQVAEGNEHARNRMIEMHLRFAVKTALQRAELFDWPFEDTFNSAVCGLITAVDHYDPDSGNAFGSYANLWMLQHINRDMPVKNTSVYYPVHKKEDYYAIYPVLKEYGCTNCEGFIECEHIRSIIKKQISEDFDGKNVDDMLLALDCMCSLEEILDHIDERDEYDYLNNLGIYCSIVNDNQEEKIISLVSMEERYKLIGYLKKVLRPREYEVLKMRFGFSRNEAMTLEEIGNYMNVSRERIRQIEKKAVMKLRQPTRRKQLEMLL